MEPKEKRKKIYDPLRRIWVCETPEEEVRQWFVGYLVNERHYPMALMANEVTIEHNGMSRRCDTVIYNKALAPIAIVEYKAPEIHLTQRAFDQIVRYNMVLGVGTLMVSNGLKVYACRVISPENYEFLKTVPFYEELEEKG